MGFKSAAQEQYTAAGNRMPRWSRQLPSCCRAIIWCMKLVQPTLTYPELRLMPDDGKRYELIDGEVFVSPSPSEKHQ